MLISGTDYARLTGDAAAADPPLGVAIQEALQMFEEELNRPLESRVVTNERVRIIPDYPGGVTGYCFPRRRPITSVANPAPPATFDHASIRFVMGAFVPGLFFVASPLDPYPFGQVSYTGGFPPLGTTIVDDNGLPVKLPATLARELAWAAYGILHPDKNLVRDGALVVSTGDSRVQYETARVVSGQLTAEAKRRIFRWKRRSQVLG